MGYIALPRLATMMSGSGTQSNQIDGVTIRGLRTIPRTKEREFSPSTCNLRKNAFLRTVCVASVNIVIEVLQQEP